MTDTFNYMTKHPYASILTAAVSTTVGTALVVQALETVGIAAGASVITMAGIAATLSIAGVMAVMGIQKAADKLATIIVENTHKVEHRNNTEEGKTNDAAVSQISLAVKKQVESSTKEKIIEPIALGRALATVGLFSKPRVYTAAIESMHTLTPTRVN